VSSDVVNGVTSILRRVGGAVTGSISRLGFASRFLVAIVWHSPQAFRRIHLTQAPRPLPHLRAYHILPACKITFRHIQIDLRQCHRRSGPRTE
jgi:hypothetical protein